MDVDDSTLLLDCVFNDFDHSQSNFLQVFGPRDRFFLIQLLEDFILRPFVAHRIQVRDLLHGKETLFNPVVHSIIRQRAFITKQLTPCLLLQQYNFS